jgi:hypothetical protein
MRYSANVAGRDAREALVRLDEAQAFIEEHDPFMCMPMGAPTVHRRSTIRQALESGTLDDVFSGGAASHLNPRSVDHLARLADGIAGSGYDPEFPIIVNQWGEIVDGHHRFAVCRLLGVEPERRVVQHKHRAYCCYPCTCGEGAQGREA